jgi:uncharacterized membrane protein
MSVSKPVAKIDKTRQVELLISNLLRIGVSLSLLVVVIGTVVSFTRHRDYLSSPGELEKITRLNAVFPHTIKSVIGDLRQLRGRAIVMTGLLMLIATPVVRVAVSIFGFVYERDRIFVLITSVVLALLLASFVLGRGG